MITTLTESLPCVLYCIVVCEKASLPWIRQNARQAAKARNLIFIRLLVWWFRHAVGKRRHEGTAFLLFAKNGNTYIALGMEADIVQQGIEAPGSPFQVLVKLLIVQQQAQGPVIIVQFG